MICPSILSADFSLLKETLQEMEKAGIEVVHFDVMDNHFVPNLTFGHKFIGDLRKHSKLFFDAHLMIENPEKNIQLYLDSGADLVTVHLEAIRHSRIDEMSELTRKAGKKFGISIKPKTAVSELLPILESVDLVLVMTVEPGFGGQKLIPECLPKITELQELKKKNNFSFIIQADGGIDRSNLETLCRLGNEWYVMGSAFFKEPDFSFFPAFLKQIKSK